LWFAAVQPSTRPDIQFSGHFGAALRRKLQLWKFITVPFAVRPHIESFDLRSYIRRDLAPQHEGMMKIDLQQIPFPHETFDLVICDHMLEHVDDPAAALREMRRVLKPGGRTICQTPYSARLTTTSEDRVFFLRTGRPCPAVRVGHRAIFHRRRVHRPAGWCRTPRPCRTPTRNSSDQ